MKTADEMFEELGFVKVHDENFIYYNNLKTDCTIEFNEVKRIIRAYDTENEVLGFGIDSDELKAIMQKCLELEWI